MKKRLFEMLLLAYAMKEMSSSVPMYESMGGYNPIFTPKRTKFKGWMREYKRSTFNKNK